MQKDVFISYSRKDSEVASRICKAFDEVGITYFIDRQGISGGFEFPTELAEAIINCKIFLYLASKNSYESRFTQSEITFAFNKKSKGSILPYIIDGSNLPLSLEFVFSAINWRRIETDPIETVLVDDLLRLLNGSSERNAKRENEVKFSFSSGVKSTRTIVLSPKFYLIKWLLFAAIFVVVVLAIVLWPKGGDVFVNEEPVVSVNTSGDKKTYMVNGVPFTMVRVAGGTFTMGALVNDSDANDNEKPSHQVTLDSYSIGETEVTQALWQAVMGSNPSYFVGYLQRPVEMVSWDDCQKFICKLNSLTGTTFRLPTEAEWEYAARGGNQSRGYKYSGSDELNTVAWHGGNSSSTTHPVKSKLPNELGLYDMSGNVEEWCADRYDSYSSFSQTNPKGASSGDCRVYRGGSWSSVWGNSNNASYRVSKRSLTLPSTVGRSFGLRLVEEHQIETLVINETSAETLKPSGKFNGHEYVDLGLSVKWATCNVGASSPENYGDYFAWGETEEKVDYDGKTYKWCNGSDSTLTKYCTNSGFGLVDNKTTLDPEDDVAHVEWGNGWRMPTLSEIQELCDKCSWQWTTVNGFSGQKVTGPNGNSIFFPASGNCNGEDVYGRGMGGDYWSATLNEDDSNDAYCFFIYGVYYDWYGYSRYYGHSVRPVTE